MCEVLCQCGIDAARQRRQRASQAANNCAKQQVSDQSTSSPHRVPCVTIGRGAINFIFIPNNLPRWCETKCGTVEVHGSLRVVTLLRMVHDDHTLLLPLA